MTLLPSKPEIERDDTHPQVIEFGDELDTAFSALKSETARAILTALYEEPTTASELADRVDISLQNTSYHLDSLCDAGLVEVADTWYSAKGKEMKVYAPTGEPLTLVIGPDESASQCRQALDQLRQENT